MKVYNNKEAQVEHDVAYNEVQEASKAAQAAEEAFKDVRENADPHPNYEQAVKYDEAANAAHAAYAKYEEKMHEYKKVVYKHHKHFVG